MRPSFSASGSDPVAFRIGELTSRNPQGGSTEVRLLTKDLRLKRLKILKEILPKDQPGCVTFYNSGDRLCQGVSQLGKGGGQTVKSS